MFNSGWFQVFLIAHIVTAVVGFGGLLARRTNAVETRGWQDWLFELSVYAVPIFGAGAVGFDDRFDFSQTWLTLAFLFYVFWVGIWIVVLRPPRNPLPLARKLATAASDLLLVAAIWVMVVKPGGLV